MSDSKKETLDIRIGEVHHKYVDIFEKATSHKHINNIVNDINAELLEIVQADDHKFGEFTYSPPASDLAVRKRRMGLACTGIAKQLGYIKSNSDSPSDDTVVTPKELDKQIGLVYNGYAAIFERAATASELEDAKSNINKALVELIGERAHEHRVFTYEPRGDVIEKAKKFYIACIGIAKSLGWKEDATTKCDDQNDDVKKTVRIDGVTLSSSDVILKVADGAPEKIDNLDDLAPGDIILTIPYPITSSVGNAVSIKSILINNDTVSIKTNELMDSDKVDEDTIGHGDNFMPRQHRLSPDHGSTGIVSEGAVKHVDLGDIDVDTINFEKTLKKFKDYCSGTAKTCESLIANTVSKPYSGDEDGDSHPTNIVIGIIAVYRSYGRLFNRTNTTAELVDHINKMNMETNAIKDNGGTTPPIFICDADFEIALTEVKRYCNDTVKWLLSTLPEDKQDVIQKLLVTSFSILFDDVMCEQYLNGIKDVIRPYIVIFSGNTFKDINNLDTMVAEINIMAIKMHVFDNDLDIPRITPTNVEALSGRELAILALSYCQRIDMLTNNTLAG